jgi:hypothetical protein
MGHFTFVLPAVCLGTYGQFLHLRPQHLCWLSKNSRDSGLVIFLHMGGRELALIR